MSDRVKEIEIELSKKFRSEVSAADDYKEGIAANARLFDGLNEILPRSKHTQYLQRIVGHFRGKDIFIFGASYDEVLFFSSLAKRVYFIAVPELQQPLPANACSWSYDEKGNVVHSEELRFDYLFSHHVVEHISEKHISQHLLSASQLLKPNGEYLVICPSKINILRSTPEAQNYHIGRYDYNSMAALGRKAGFKSYRAVLNPYLLNFFVSYNHFWLEPWLVKLPGVMLAPLALNSLYVRLRKIPH